MTFKELQFNIGPETRAHWRQTKHKGWVHKDAQAGEDTKIYGIVRGGIVSGKAIVYENARVEEKANVFADARIDGNSVVRGHTQVYGSAHIAGDARIQGDAIVCGDAKVYGDTCVFGNAYVYDNATISGSARVSGFARVRGNAHICGYAQVVGDVVSGVWDSNPLCIHASRWTVSHCGPKQITVGCNTGSFDWWTRNFQAVCHKHQITSEERNEYWGHIRYIIKTANNQTQI